MGKYAIIESGVVTNLVAAEADYAATQGWTLVESVTPQPSIGWTYNGTTFAPSAPLAPTPQDEALATVAQLAASIPGHIASAQTDASAIQSLQAGAALTQEHVTALQNNFNGWVALLGGLDALLRAQGLA